MKKLMITLEITDPDCVEEYADVDPLLVMEDLREGDLLSFCRIISVKEEDIIKSQRNKHSDG